MSEEEIELQINVNIGNNKYLIRVPKNEDLKEFIHSFLVSHRLNIKLEAQIIKMVEEKLTSTHHQQRQRAPLVQKKKEKLEEIPSNGKGSDLSEELSENSGDSVNKGIKNKLLNKIKDELQSHEQSSKDNSSMYQKWKMKQKEKLLKQKTPPKSNQQSRVTQCRQNISPDHFYKKGLQFKHLRQQNCETQFKKHYPFQLHEKDTNQTQQSLLCSRLSKERKNNHLKSFIANKLQKQVRIQQEMERPSRINDEIKNKVKICDQQVDRALYSMIQNGQLSHAKYRPKSRSPFRKTALK